MENGVSNKGLETVLQCSGGRLLSPRRVKGQCGGKRLREALGEEVTITRIGVGGTKKPLTPEHSSHLL